MKEAAEGDELSAGTRLLAPAGRHLTFRRADDRVVAHLDVRPLDTPHRPSVDVLFQSAAEVYGARTLGVVMTGWAPTDARARRGSRREADRSSPKPRACVVYGMPRSVVEAGLASERFRSRTWPRP